MVIEEYFERLRPLALGIAACGGIVRLVTDIR